MHDSLGFAPQTPPRPSSGAGLAVLGVVGRAALLVGAALVAIDLVENGDLSRSYLLDNGNLRTAACLLAAVAAILALVVNRRMLDGVAIFAGGVLAGFLLPDIQYQESLAVLAAVPVLALGSALTAASLGSAAKPAARSLGAAPVPASYGAAAWSGPGPVAVPATPAGWYPEPGGAHMRWWDGAAWTTHSRRP